jgi:predicted ATPase
VQSELSFQYSYKFPAFQNNHEVTFRFDSRAPLGRVNVLVGENASGKTAVLGRLAFALSGTPAEGEIIPDDLQLSRVLAISFSAFDQFRRPDHSNRLYDYTGLRKHEPGKHGKHEDDEIHIADAFARLDDRANDIRKAGRVEAWCQALRTCGIDPGITDPEVLSTTMKQLSSGQKFAVFVFTNLVAKLKPRAMVLFDEPELHTHPRMLSGIMRALTKLLSDFDSYSILATHSPIVLQEVPASAIRIFGRCEDYAQISAYPGESFGAPLDQLVREAFQLARSDRNFVHYIEGLKDSDGRAVRALESALAEDLPLSTKALLARLRKGEA